MGHAPLHPPTLHLKLDTRATHSVPCNSQSVASEHLYQIAIDDMRVVKAMNQWLAVSLNPEYILVNPKDGIPMSSLHITQTLTGIFKRNFDKSVGSTLLRHIVLTEKFGQQLEDMEHMADIMAHDVSTAHKIYIKKVDNEDSDGSSS